MKLHEKMALAAILILYLLVSKMDYEMEKQEEQFKILSAKQVEQARIAKEMDKHIMSINSQLNMFWENKPEGDYVLTPRWTVK